VAELKEKLADLVESPMHLNNDLIDNDLVHVNDPE